MQPTIYRFNNNPRAVVDVARTIDANASVARRLGELRDHAGMKKFTQLIIDEGRDQNAGFAASELWTIYQHASLNDMTVNGSTLVLMVSFLNPEGDEPEDDRYELGTLGAFGSFDAFDTATSIEEAKEAVRREHEEWAEACGYEAAPIEWRETDRGLIGTTQGKDYEHDEEVHEIHWAIRKVVD